MIPSSSKKITALSPSLQIISYMICVQEVTSKKRQCRGYRLIYILCDARFPKNERKISDNILLVTFITTELPFPAGGVSCLLDFARHFFRVALLTSVREEVNKRKRRKTIPFLQRCKSPASGKLSGKCGNGCLLDARIS